jgi:hypothetical protein
MTSPKWRTATAASGDATVRVRRNDSGSVSIMLVTGPLSIIAAISPADVKFLFTADKPVPEGAA